MFPHNILQYMDMEHMKFLMTAFQERNLHSWIGSAVLYYDIVSIQLNAQIWIAAWADIWTDTSAENLKHKDTFFY